MSGGIVLPITTLLVLYWQTKGVEERKSMLDKARFLRRFALEMLNALTKVNALRVDIRRNGIKRTVSMMVLASLHLADMEVNASYARVRSPSRSFTQEEPTLTIYGEYGGETLTCTVCGRWWVNSPIDRVPSMYCEQVHTIKEWDGSTSLVHITMQDDHATMVYQDGIAHVVSKKYVRQICLT